MASYSRQLLSGTPFGGRNIPVVATATPGTLIHTVVGGTDNFDEIYIWAANVTNALRKLTVEWGGVGDPSDHLVKQFSIAANSAPIAIAVGQSMNGGPLTIAAFADSGNAINITGYVNRING